MDKPRVLIVDDDPNYVSLLEELLSPLQLTLIKASNGEEAALFLKEPNLKLILSDIRMDTGNGLDLLREVHAQTLPVKVILLTGDRELAKNLDPEEIGCEAVLLKTASVDEIKKEVSKILFTHENEWESQVALGVQNLKLAGVNSNLIKESLPVLKNALHQFSSLKASKGAVGLWGKQSSTVQAHQSVVSLLGAILVGIMGWSSEKNRFNLIIAGFFHDIGYLGLPEEVQAKALSEMDAQEYQIYQTHPELSWVLLSGIEGLSEEVKRIILQHHEDVLGQGYPEGISGSKLYPLARLLSLLDAYCDELFALNPSERGRSGIKILEFLKHSRPNIFEGNDAKALKLVFTEGSIDEAKIKYESYLKRS